jgi:hypothetical protein
MGARAKQILTLRFILVPLLKSVTGLKEIPCDNVMFLPCSGGNGWRVTARPIRLINWKRDKIIKQYK